MPSNTNYEAHVRKVEDFPKPGVRFYDIAPLLGNGAVFGSLIHDMSEPLVDKVDKVVGFDARGFLFGGAMAVELGVGFAMLRKPGKLPGETTAIGYDLEYGSNQIEIQPDSIVAGERVVLVDDIIATGGTALAGIALIEACKGEVVEFCSVIDLPNLEGSAKIKAHGIAVRTIMALGLEQN